MLFVQRTQTLVAVLMFAAAVVAVVILLWAAMRFSGVMLRLPRDSGVELLTRIAGLLLSATAVQLMAGAIRAFVRQG